MSQFCGSGLRSRSKVTSAALAIHVLASSAQVSPVKYPADFFDIVDMAIAISAVGC